MKTYEIYTMQKVIVSIDVQSIARELIKKYPKIVKKVKESNEYERDQYIDKLINYVNPNKILGIKSPGEEEYNEFAIGDFYVDLDREIRNIIVE